MHELSIALSLIEVAEEEARRSGVTNIAALHVRIGPLSGVVKDALLSAWELAREDTRLQNTTLMIEESPIVGYCPACQRERPIVSIQEFCCVVCGTPIAEIVEGRELDLVALEVDA